WNFINCFNCFFPSSGIFTVNSSLEYQEILGFGGAITDSVGVLLKTLPEEAQDQIISQYFSETGLNYAFIRIPIAGCDYSTRLYTYDDNGVGQSLENFQLAPEDYDLKIPYIKRAQSMTSKPIKIVAAPWMAPERMTECRYPLLCIDLFRKLKSEYYGTYAEYMIRFLDAYKEEGLDIWGLSTQNEPEDGLIGILAPVNLGWTPWEQGEWISQHLGPQLNASKHRDVKIIIYDDQRPLITIWTAIVMSYAEEYISGIGVHSYLDIFPGALVSLAHKQFPDLFILSTEFSITRLITFLGPTVRLGGWDNLEHYVADILENLNHDVNGWIDWNILLNEEGGPTAYETSGIDSPIIVNDTGREYYKQPMWYGLAHISRFVPPGSRRVDLKGPMFTYNVFTSAFVTPQKRLVLIMLNRRSSSFEANINVGSGNYINLKMSPNSVHTIICNRF
ncbi:hypothetical protein L9F63_012784, partial [Diploptera punctata]